LIRLQRRARLRAERRARRARRTPVRVDLPTLAAAEVVCVLAWAVTGTVYALLAALVAALGIVLAAVTPEQPPTLPKRRVR
jgi:uncharacterized membrane protein